MRILNEALATEIVCVLRYKRHYFMAAGIHAEAVADEFLEHANEEQGHADQIADAHRAARRRARLRSPRASLTRSHAEYVEGTTLVDMIREDLVAERDRDRVLRGDDPLPRRRRSDHAAHARGASWPIEEEHADDMENLLETVGQEESRGDRWAVAPRSNPAQPSTVLRTRMGVPPPL